MVIDYEQDTLYGPKVIMSIGYDEEQIIKDILYLHAPGKQIDVDPTYSIGNFYKGGIPQPKHKFDKYPQLPGIKEATVDNLPLDNNSCGVVIFDPPFVIGGELRDDLPDTSNVIAKRFDFFQSFGKLKEMYRGALEEFARILKDDGIVIFKCQDVVAGGMNHFTHCWVMYEAMKHGFYPKDLFILLAKNRLTDNRKQQHARKFHSYFIILKKCKCMVNYE